MVLWTRVCKYLFETLLLILVGIHPEVELLDHTVVLFLIFLRHCYTGFRTSDIITCWAHSVVTSACGFQLLLTLVNTWYFLCALDSRYELLAHCDFDLHFSCDWWCWASFHILVGHLYIIFGEMSVHILCPFFKSGWFFWVVGVLFIFLILTS